MPQTLAGLVEGGATPVLHLCTSSGNLNKSRYSASVRALGLITIDVSFTCAGVPSHVLLIIQTRTH